MNKTPREDFIEFMSENVRINGLDNLSATILSTLFLEPAELSLEEISKKTGYSLSAVCTSANMLEHAGMVSRIKKPKTKKVYIYMEKSLVDMLLRVLEKKHDIIIGRCKQHLPVMIERYKQLKTKNDRRELQIISQYYKDVLATEGLLKEFIDKMSKLKQLRVTK
jgi:DNA-binding transcriptional regulator GbsR (MarR family)